jgi:hypothetical protein
MSLDKDLWWDFCHYSYEISGFLKFIDFLENLLHLSRNVSHEVNLGC